jgi:DNA adenine methylase
MDVGPVDYKSLSRAPCLRRAVWGSEVYNDLDGEVVNLFRVVRDRGAELVPLLELTTFGREDYQESFEISEDPLEQARRTVVRSFMGFGSNSLCRQIKSGFRSNSNRSGTTPALDWRNLPKNLPALIERLRGVVIERCDAIELMPRHDTAATLYYCDPPYVHSTRSTLVASKAHGHHGYNHEMTNEDHERFASGVRVLKGMVLVSGYASDLYETLFWDWQRVERKAHADGALDRTEVLWMNYEPPQGELL